MQGSVVLSIPPSAVLDTWPVLEWLKDRQPAASSFLELLEAASNNRTKLSISRMNYGEVMYSIHKGIPFHRIESAKKAFQELPIETLSVDDALVDAAAALKAMHSISYADGFAAALAMRLQQPLVTGDKEFLPLMAEGLERLWIGG